ncbi:hypothetical protein [Planococcus lenghuensis]|uniref:Uncharacterized protein n=1 Tax=Planococcus lenghuensis TaxID=2213202 RepID=A0A1Q2L0V2_9BACL|nr:hypothetical protein [Planococcus lenghuensis]AQQ53677.1 hypothetical protein B0X71_11705 [Planococcus lenghuensis]
MHDLDSGDRKPAQDPTPNEPSRKRSLYGCLGAILLLVLILVLFGACALIGGEEEEAQNTYLASIKNEVAVFVAREYIA